MIHLSHHLHIEQHKHPSPSTVDNVGHPKPHEHYEDHEVAMVVVTNAVEHPGYGRAKVKECTLQTANTFQMSLEYMHYTQIQSTVAHKFFVKNLLPNYLMHEENTIMMVHLENTSKVRKDHNTDTTKEMYMQGCSQKVTWRVATPLF